MAPSQELYSIERAGRIAAGEIGGVGPLPAVYESIAEALVACGTEVVFGLMGAGTDRLTCQLVDVHGVRYIATRHEHGAVAMADGYSRVTGRPGVALISADAGLTNAATALTTARLAGSNVLIIVGDQAAAAKSNQARIDQVPMQTALGIPAIPVAPSTARSTVYRAFRHLDLDGGPIMVNLPWDVSVAEATEVSGRSDVRSHGHFTGQCPDDETIERVLGLIAMAKRPVVIAGHGATGDAARKALTDLSQRIGALTATTLLAKGLWRDEPFDLGVCGSFSTDAGTAMLATADLVIAFGCSLNPHTRGHGAMFPTARIVHVDRDPAAIGRFGKVDIGIVGECAVVAEALAAAASQLEGAGLEAFGRDPEGWRTAETARSVATASKWGQVAEAEPAPGFAEPREVMRALDELLPADRLVAIDIGYFMSYPAVYLGAGPAPAMVCPWEYGAIGSALGPAIGAAVGRPELYPVLVIGDGGLAAVLNELDTIIRYRLPMLVVVMDDEGYRAERELFHQRGVSTGTADMPSPDFAALAETFGFAASTITSAAQARAVLRDLDPSAPTFLRVMIDPRGANPEMAKAMQGL